MGGGCCLLLKAVDIRKLGYGTGGKMKTSDWGFKILSATLMALLITGLLHRFTYSAFCMAKKGQVFWYNPDLWKQYYVWMPIVNWDMGREKK